MQSPATLAGLIVITSLVSEDAAALAAASLASHMTLDVRLAFAAAAGGIWIGDLGLYLFGLPLRSLAGRWELAARCLERAEVCSAQRRGSWSMAVFASRFIPGTRLPLYTAAGLVRLPLLRFATITAVAVLLWVTLLFLATHSATRVMMAISGGSLIAVASAAVSIIGLLAIARTLPSEPGLRRAFRKYSRWEFWPAWLFYVPVALMCLWHGIRHRGLSLPTVANPGQKNGGIIGESKFALLSALSQIAPDSTPACALIDESLLPERLQQFDYAMKRLGLSYPVVLKPDTAQRGQGFKKIASLQEAYRYLGEVSVPVILQEYVAAEHEVGIFYYRFPHQTRGHIFSITDKEFPSVTGDGVRTLGELIEADDRASLIAATYLRRFGTVAFRVVPSGEKVRLVEAGNHARGCIFKDGMHLFTPELETRIDEIARRVPGFYIGRFDLRYRSREELRVGKFQILELNGAASEATNIYDCRNSLFSAYNTLFRQWKLVYAIGAANRAAGHDCTGALSVFADWLRFRQVARCYPEAD